MKPLTPSEFADIFDRHQAYWDDRRQEMRRLRHAYLMRFWKRAQDYDEDLLIETSRAYELVESYVASLFVRDPSVVVKDDIHGKGDANIAELAANRWLRKQRDSIEDALRLSIIYPFAGLKLSIGHARQVLNRPELSAVQPWDIIVDETASSWSSQRYCGHRYLMPLAEAKERYGAKKYAPRTWSLYIDNVDADTAEPENPPNSGHSIKAADSFVEVVEVFDLRLGKMWVWSADWKRDAWLHAGVKIETGVDEEDVSEHLFDDIPYKTASGEYRLPLIPLYLSREPDCPMRGFSGLRRVYDQLREVNHMRTFQAQGVRRAARQWITRRGFFDEEAKSKMAQGQDGEVIEVDISANQSIGDGVIPLPNTPVPPELQRYADIVDEDFSRGSVMAPFTRGQATQATATEIQALAAYTASEIGRMARSRDQAITDTVLAYLAMVGVLVDDGADMVKLDGKIVALTAEDVTGDFDLYAEDSGNTPMSEAARKQELERLTPMLQALGVPEDFLLNLLQRAFELPADMVAAASSNRQRMEEEMLAQAAGAAAPGEIPPEMLSQARGGPARVEEVLPPGGVV